MNKILNDDINLLLLNENKLLSSFNSSTFLITGATGLICSFIIKLLSCYSLKYNANIKIYALCRNQNKAKKIFSDINFDNLFIIKNDIINLANIIEDVDYVIHGASITESDLILNYPVDVIKTSILGTINLLDKLINKDIKSFVYLSSIEAYGLFNNEELIGLTEDVLGSINLKNPRNSYPESKRMCENICSSYFFQYGLPTKIVRLAQTYGSSMNINDNRLFSYLAQSIYNNSNIVLSTKGETTKNYCYITDAVSAILYVLKKSENNEIFNIASDDSISSIYDLSKLFIKLSNKNLDLVILNNEEYSRKYMQQFKYYLNNGKLKGLGWKSYINLENGVKRFIEYYCIEKSNK